MNATLAAAAAAQGGCGRRPLGPGRQLAITLTYVLGVAGNVAALLILRGQARHRRHALMLRCLAANDLVALTGMLLQLYLKLYLPCEYFSEYWSCVVRVLWRLFGLGSGCVAIVMAVERWLALTHPFFYQMHVTYHMIKQSIFILWAVVLVLVCLPLTGFGIYFEDGKCVRLRKAKAPEDVAYAYLYFTFGTVLCACIVVCNLAVIRALCQLGCRGRRRRLGVRILRHASRHGEPGAASEIMYNAATTEEVAFARLMAVLCIMFVVCWVPQLMSIPMTQLVEGSRYKLFFDVAECLLALHFMLDPYVYVLLRHRRRGTCVPGLLKRVFRRCSTSTATASASLALTDHEGYE
ncbi:prostaglandin E2 receptor EP4 subtype [Schistocerca piceifrons]|uniref:prostaglandin E2 receptor EP4 subtype n=1 Tax=Schistocerca piceifrons TaxID=274613 RepID=UPI001F5F0214|nr:prostaglandin E2 receptor EP4 subtype [Schistocerca piceifrons]